MKHYIITDVAEDGTITARPMDAEPIEAWTNPLTKEEYTISTQPGHVIEAKLAGIAEPDLLSSILSSNPDDEGEPPAGMG